MAVKYLFFCLLIYVVPAQAQKHFTGRASFYAESFNGQKTANGEIYYKDSLTAAHKTLPFGTVVLVTNLWNRRSVTVRINDRGPFKRGRVIDLSRAAANQLNFTKEGVIWVRVQVIYMPEVEK